MTTSVLNENATKLLDKINTRNAVVDVVGLAYIGPLAVEKDKSGYTVIGYDVQTERVDPGIKQINTKNTPKVVGGMKEQFTEVTAALYGSVLESYVHRVLSPAVTEREKN